MNKIGKLFVVATPIGNPEDITLRAIRTLRECDEILCEDRSNASRLLKKLEIEKKEFIVLNEHNEIQQIESVLLQLAQGKDLALISDCGTPLFSDPGHDLVAAVSQAGFEVIPVPGVSALTAAISVTPLHMRKFYFAGFLPRTPIERLNELKRLKRELPNTPIILMDTPYRLAAVLKDVMAVFGKSKVITLACDLTTHKEQILTDSCAAIAKKIGATKAEFMLIIQN